MPWKTSIGWIRFKHFDRDTVLVLVIFRALNALCAQTYFVPDEYWQGPEVSHRLVFGYGITMEPGCGIGPEGCRFDTLATWCFLECLPC